MLMKTRKRKPLSRRSTVSSSFPKGEGRKGRDAPARRVKKAADGTNRLYKAGRDVNIVEIGANAHAEQAAAGKTVEQERLEPREGMVSVANVAPIVERTLASPLPEPT